MEPHHEPKQIDNVLEELKNTNDRSAIIVGASLVEYGLEKLLQSRSAGTVFSYRN
jgi:hypothetical protein